MKTKVLCNNYSCIYNCAGKCNRKEIAIDIEKGCVMFKKRNAPVQVPIEEEPFSLR